MSMRKRHKCPPSIELTLRIDGYDIIGPITAEHLAYIVKFGHSDHDAVDLLDAEWATYTVPPGVMHTELIVRYLPEQERRYRHEKVRRLLAHRR
jgi:hypothetical protein